LLIVLLPVMGGYMYWSVHRSTQGYIHDLERESRAIARSLRPAMEDDIGAGEWDQVRDVFERIRAEGTEAAVFTTDGKLRFSLPGFPERLRALAQWPKTGETNWPFEFRIDFGSNGEWVCDLVRLRNHSGAVFGYLLVANDFTDVREDLTGRVRISIIAGIATILVIAGLIALATRKYISRPLAELSRRVLRFSADDSSGRPPMRDEVQLLIGEFAKLGEQLGKARADLLEKHRSEIELERRLLHSDRLATIGSLAAGLAHEIGTPMGVIRGRAEYLLNSHSDEKKTSDGLEIIITQIDRITNIVRMLLDYSRYREPLKLTTDVRPIVQHSLRLIETEAWKRGVRVRPALGEVPLRIDCDPDQLQQVFVNLAVNALDAMRTVGGILTVRARVDVDNGNSRITLIFEDTGPGIAEVHRERIFDPFFTTKQPGQGTGMGLAICQTIVQSHNGKISYESADAGTRFFVSFPLSRREAAGLTATAMRNGNE
jgi:signal transduction histidine kinase